LNLLILDHAFGVLERLPLDHCELIRVASVAFRGNILPSFDHKLDIRLNGKLKLAFESQYIPSPRTTFTLILFSLTLFATIFGLFLLLT